MLNECIFQRFESRRGFEECSYHKRTDMMFCTHVVKKAQKMQSCINGNTEYSFQGNTVLLKEGFFLIMFKLQLPIFSTIL